jgi:hypothetical protein
MIVEVSAALLVVGLLAYSWMLHRRINASVVLGFNYERSATLSLNKHMARTLCQYAECESDRYACTGTTGGYYEITLYELGLSRPVIAELRCPHKIANRCLEIVKALKA